MASDRMQITSADVLAALSNLGRRRLLDVLAVDGPGTVSTLADRTGMAVGSVSHHLKVLLRAGLVEEAPSLAKDRREHWWQQASSSIGWASKDFEDEPASQAIASAATTLNLEHHLAKVRTWHAEAEEVRRPWEDAAFATDTWLQLTPDELLEMAGEVNQLLKRWHDRSPDDRAERSPVFVFAHGFPSVP
jgi:DNA-binding transcriptional ArsR family regulator